MITSLTEFYQILRAIVIHHKPADLCNRLNSFMVIDRVEQLNTDNAEMTMQHYQSGLFWARDWYNRGANPNKLTKEYDLLAVEALKGLRKEGVHDRDYMASQFVFLVGTIEKTEKRCPDTVEGKRLELMKTLNEILKELVTYQKYEITPDSGDPFTGWASAAQAAALVESETWTEADATGLMLDASFRNQDFELYTPSWNHLDPIKRAATGKTTLVDNVVAVATRIDLEICNPNDAIAYKYDTPSVSALGVVKCEC